MNPLSTTDRRVFNSSRPLLIICLCLSWFFTFSASTHAEGLKGYTDSFVFTKGNNVPANQGFIDETGKRQQLSDFKGQLVLINLWATWCAACIYEMPELQALQQDLKEKGLTVLTLNQDLSSGQQALAFLNKQGITQLTGHLDPDFKFGYAYGQKLLPMTLLFDTSGNQIGYLAGAAAWNSPEAKSLISNYLPRKDL